MCGGQAKWKVLSQLQVSFIYFGIPLISKALGMKRLYILLYKNFKFI